MKRIVGLEAGLLARQAAVLSFEFGETGGSVAAPEWLDGSHETVSRGCS